MVFPTTGLLDDFNRADEGPPPSASWSNIGTDGIQVISNEVGSNGSGFRRSVFDTTFGPDCEVFVTITVKPGAPQGFAIYLRNKETGDTATWDGYKLQLQDQSGTDKWEIYRIDNGAKTKLGSTLTLEFNVSDRFGLEAIGSTLKAYHDTGTGFSEVMSRTDSTYGAAGTIGAGQRDITGRFDDFSGGEVIKLKTGWISSYLEDD